jgi:pilus assembly protein CpaE
MFDFIVIDGGQSLNDNSRAIMKMSDKVIIISVLNLPTIINLKILLDIFWKRGFPREENTEIIVNRLLKDSEISLKDLEESVKKKVLCCIPNDYDIFMHSLNQGDPVCAQIKGNKREIEIRNVYGEMASTLAGKSVEKKKKGFFARR